MPYTLYIGNKNYSSWSLRPWVLLTQLNIPFEEQLVPFDDGELGSSYERFREFSPTGLVPCLHDDDMWVWESLSIVEYIADRHEQVWPSDTAAKAWARSATAEMHAGFSALRNQCPMSVGLRITLHKIDTDLSRDLDRLAELWQQGLERFGGPYLAGSQFSAVDAFFCPVAYRIQTYALDTHPVLHNYSQRLLELPAMQSWTNEALTEPWREPAHEEEFLALGNIDADLRIS
ncbi:MAG: glutathione S-transferase family protein [Pseudomonadota bacterium]